MGRSDQAGHLGGPLRIFTDGILAALLDFVEAVAQGFDQRAAAVAVGEQIVLQVGVALHNPHVSQHLVEHPCGAAGYTLGAQRIERLPGFGAKQPDDDLAVGERSVVVGNFAQALGHCVTWIFAAENWSF